MNNGGSPATVTDAMGRVTQITYLGSNATGPLVHQITYPSGKTVTVNFETSYPYRVTSVQIGTRTWTYAYADANGQRTTTVTDPLNHVRTVVSDLTTSQVISDKDAVNRVTQYHYDTTYGRLDKVTFNLGGYTTYAYDSLGNRTNVTAYPDATWSDPLN